ncbi:histidine kinase [Lewinella sp. W8]|uniref:histidine kinase n=1 Tax=Lewinella sp. W8 TaxID=2528208 RepID=UPI00156671ED|nr:histidine kinase [Lewinella sp. W8]
MKAGFMVLFLIGCVSTVRGQEMDVRATLDSLQRVYLIQTDVRERGFTADKLSEFHFRNANYDSCRFYAMETLRLGRMIGHDTLIGHGFRSLSIIDRREGAFDASLADSDSAAIYYRAAGHLMGELVILSNLGYQLSSAGRCGEAIEALALADSLMAKNNTNLMNRVKSRNTYCATLGDCGQYDLIPRLAKEFLDEVREEKWYRLEASLYNRLIIAYRNLGELDSALVYVNRMSPVLKYTQSKALNSSFYTNAASVYHDLGDLDRAAELLNLGIASARKQGLEDSENFKEMNLGIIESERGNFTESVQLIEDALPYFEKRADAGKLMEAYAALSRSYAGLDRYQEAYEFASRSYVIQDSLQERRQAERVEEMAAKLEANRAWREYTLAQMELDREKRAARTRQRLTLGGFGTLMIASLGGTLIVRARRKRKHLEYAKRQAELRYNLLRAQMNPHFIFNSLNAIQSFFSSRKFAQGNEYLGAFSQLVRRVLEQTGQKRISLAEELETLELYLRLEQQRLGTGLQFAFRLTEEVEPDLVRVPPLILQPFVENAIWHGIAPSKRPGKIDICVDYDEDLDALVCLIEDDGLGMSGGPPQQEGHRSRGVEITRERLGDKGRVNIRNRKDIDLAQTGVRTELVIPLWE